MERSRNGARFANPAQVVSSLQHDIGQLLVGGFQGKSIDPTIARLARAGRLGGSILFRRNLGTLEEVRDLTNEIHQLYPQAPLMVAVDQEGGRVQRLRTPFPELPPMRALGDANRKSLAHLAGRILGDALRVMGFDQDYAPVLDVDSNPNNPVIGDRSFSTDANVVCRLGAAFIDGLQERGVAACGKHFPGHGDTDLDSHRDLPRLAHSMERLRAVELAPFGAAARAGVAAIMSAHVVFSELDPDWPATLSAKVLRPILRDELRFEGVIVSDDLEMKAIADYHPIEEAAVAAIAAGCDQILICHHPENVERAFQAIEKAIVDGRLVESAVRESAERVKKMKAEFVRVDETPADLSRAFPTGDHQALLAQLKPSGDIVLQGDPTERGDGALS